jgi:hypothetical protein
MIEFLRLFFSKSHWRHSFSLSKAGLAFLGALGGLWLLTEMAAFASEAAGRWLAGYWYVGVGLAMLSAVWSTRPPRQISCKLDGRDVLVRIVVGDIFQQDGALVIGSNTTFDTHLASGLIAIRSVQGQFTQKYYDNLDHLDRDLERALDGEPFEEIKTSKPGKQREYQIGTVAKLRARSQTAYFVAIARLSEHGTAKGSYDDLKIALAKLWEFIARRGDIESIAMPVLGSGFARIAQPREAIVRDIIDSFLAACSSSQFCSGLTIVIPVRDFYRHEINLPELASYVRHVCRYTPYHSRGDRGEGTPIA